jgi:hypothetical protein
MNVIPHLRTQLDIYERVREMVRDTGVSRWSEQEVNNSINKAITAWSSRVRVPFLYSLTTGFTLGDYDYALPWYVQPPIDVQVYKQYFVDGLPVQTSDGSMSTWVDLPAYGLEPDGSGGHTLRLGVVPYTTDARVIWWAQNGNIPTVAQTINADIATTAATTLTIGDTPRIGRAGYVKIDDEWMAYSDYTQASSVTTLQNLLRGINGTTAATHSSGAAIYWGVAAPREDLYDQLENRVMAEMHSLPLQDASPKEIEHHTFQLRFYRQLADEFWRTYVPERQGRLRLSRAGIGEL